jgi:hypothetical protein
MSKPRAKLTGNDGVRNTINNAVNYPVTRLEIAESSIIDLRQTPNLSSKFGQPFGPESRDAQYASEDACRWDHDAMEKSDWNESMQQYTVNRLAA